MIQLWHIAWLHVQTALLGCLVLAFVDVTVLIANGCGMRAKGWDLAESNHLWPQIVQCLLMSLLEKLSGVSAKETTLIKGHHIRLELLDGEIC